MAKEVTLPLVFQTTTGRGYAIAVLSAVILSTTAIFIRYLTQTYHVPALVVAFWRDVFVALTLYLIFAAFKPDLLRLDRGEKVFFIGFGFIVAIFNSFWTVSVAMNGAAVSTVLAYCSAAFTALLGWWIFKERLDWAKILAVILCLGGCALLSEAINPDVWRVNLVGILTGILSGLLYSIYSLLGRSASTRGLNPWKTLFYSFGSASIFLGLFNLVPAAFLPGSAGSVRDIFWLGSSWDGWFVLFLLAAVPTVLGFGLYNVSLGNLPTSVANLILTLEPFCTAGFAFLLLGERFKAIQLSGGVLILAGVAFLRIYEARFSRPDGTQIR
jgi:drug/metabolite transporter (DMT)-like permease